MIAALCARKQTVRMLAEVDALAVICTNARRNSGAMFPFTHLVVNAYLVQHIEHIYQMQLCALTVYGVDGCVAVG